VLIERLKVYVLNDNEGSPGFINEWGLSLFIEAGNLKFLFDSDSSPSVIEHNSKELGVNLESVSFFFLSHEHLDHLGGAEALPEGKLAYVPEGTRSSLLRKFKVVEVNTTEEIEKNIWSTGPLGRDIKEQSMVVQGPFGNLLFVGCSHPGIDLITEHAYSRFGKIRYLIGGFHKPGLSSLVKALKMTEFSSPIHCSGEMAKVYAKASLGDHYLPLRTGSVVSVEKDFITVERF
jgi:7,8-dihydropterin-6-yl-methyl-4-(beta-D-ribofuranosyl)aminobenzene 5'-phosphate synthase